MPENKRYLIEIPGLETGSGIWDADKWERNKEAFMADYPDANVFELGDYDPEDTNENDQFMLTFEDDPDSSGVWDAAKWERNKEAFTADNPEAKVSRVRYVDYWGEQATANRERRKALEQPDAERNARLAEIGYYDDLSYGQGEFNMDTDLGYGLKPLSSAIETNSVSGETTYLDPRVQEFFVNDTAETERQAEIARLDAEYESNPSVIRQREIEAQIAKEREEYIDKSLAEIRADIETEVDAIEAGKGAFQKTASAQGMGDAAIIQQAMDFMKGKDAGQAMVQNERMETYNSAIKLFEKARQAREVAGKGFWAATGDVAKDKLRDLATQSDIEMYNQIGGILTRLEDKLGSLDDVGEDVLEANLSKEEQALIKAFFEYNSAMSDAQQDMSKAYKGGKIFGESVGFMLEFLATGGLAGGTGKAASSGVGRALVKWASKAAKGTAKRAFRTGTTKALRGLSSAAVGTLARTVAAPGTYRNMAEQSVKIEDGHLDRTKNATKAFFDSYIENLSEISGGVIGKSLGMFGLNPSKLLGKVSFGKIGQLLADNRLAQGLSKGVKALFGEQGALTKLGFNGIFEEVEEEYIGNFIREVTGVQPGALAEMHKDGNFGAMLIGFAPMTLFGAGMSAANMAATNIEAANLGKKLRETLGQHYTEDAVSHMMSLVDNAENADEVWKAIEPMAGALNEEETTMLYQYGAFKAQNKTMLFARKAQERQLADAKRAEIQQDYGRFWQEGEDGAQSVQMADLNDGRRVFVLSAANEQGEMAVVDTRTGETGIANVADIKSAEQDGVTSPQTRTWSMDAFLDYTIALDRRSAEQTRMVNERDQQIEALKSGITEGMEINLGTEGSPVIMLATGQFTKDGVLAGDASGNIHTIGWEQVADALGTPIRVKTDQDLIDEETAAIAARRAERRKKAGSASQQLRAALDETAQQTAEVVSLEERHIPKNPDGSVNETAFWEQDPEGYAQWNDEQNKDGGADTMRQLAVSKMLLAGVLAEAQKATQTSNPAERKAAEQAVREIQDKIDRYTAIEQSYVERAIAPLRERAMKWNSLTGASVILVENEEQLAEISGEAARQSAGGARVRGFAKDGRAYIYLPGVQDAAEIDAVFVHEAVSHQGLKGLLGQKGFDELCEQVWQMMSPEMQNVFINYPGVNGNRLAAADEYIAHIAERMGTGVADETERTIWEKIVDFVRNILRAMGIEVGMNERELSDLLHMAYADLARNMSEAEKIAQQNAERKEAVGAASTTARQMYDEYIKEGLTPEEVSQGVQNDFNAAKEAYDAKVAEKPTIKAGESTASFIERKKAYNEELGRLEQELRMQQALMDEIAKIQNTAMETAVEEAPVAEEVLEDNGIGVDGENGDARFSATEARELLDVMQAGAEILVPRMLTEDVWKNEIEGRFFTSPIGEVKFGENQYDKNVGKERSREFGMLIPTIERPDLIFEEYDPKEGAERQTKYVFIKTFLDEAGEKHINYASVSVRQEGMEVVTSSHRLRDKQVLNRIEKEQMLWNRFASDSTSSAQGGSTDQSNALSDSKDSENPEIPSKSARFSVITPQMDAEYLAAVERGDMETAQRMVIEAARLAMPYTKVVDKKGNPAVVHHGTKGKFNTFAYSREDIGFHFGTNGTARTRIGRGKDARIMQVFLNLENPLIIDKDLGSWDADYIVKDLLKKEMMSYDDAKAILLTPNGYKRNSVSALVDLRQWMSNNGYDGIVYPNWYESDGKDSYIAFNRNQIKSADPVTYDGAGNVIPLSERFNPENEDIRFSTVRIDPNANQQAEGNVMFSTRRGSLVGMHNISEDKLRKVIKQGGSANPSAAVIDIERQSFDSYGEISFIMPSSLVDAGTGRNAGTFTADAWTPTYPQVSRRFSDDELQRKYWRDISAIPEEMSHEVRMAFDSWLDNRNASGLAYMFLHERGEAPGMVRVEAKFPQEIKDKVSAILGEGRTGLYGLSAEEKQAILELYIQEEFGGNREEFDKSIADRIQRIEDRLSTGKVPSFVEKRITLDLQWMKEHGYDYDELSKFVSAITADIRHAGEVNGAATTNRALDYIKDNGLEKEFDRWKESLNDRYGIKEYLFDGYTPSGNPRWLPNTMENASRLMNKQGLAGATGMAVSFNRFVATLAPKKKTLSDIRASKDLLVEDEKLVDDFREKWSEVFFDLGVKCQPDAKGYEDYGLKRLTEAAQKKNPGAYLKKEYGVELSQEDLQKLDEMIKAIKTEFPARYFEIKFQRPVYLNEFAAAVMPTTASEDVKQAVSEAGLPIFEYDSAVEGSRHEATLKATDMDSIRFSIANENQAIFVSNAARAVEAIKMEKATPAQWLAMIEKNGGLKAGEDKWMGLSDWLKASKAKTLTKAEVLDFINENMIVIEEGKYGEVELSALQEEFDAIYDNIIDNVGNEDESELQLWEVVMNPMERAWEELRDRYSGGDDFDMAFSYDSHGNIEVNDPDAAGYFLGIKPINHTRLHYTTNGLQNNHEIALTVPTIESWNEEDEIHFGDAGEGRAVAWVRFGDTQIVEEGSYMEYEPKNDVEREIKDYIEYAMRNGDDFNTSVGYAYNQITDAPQESVGWTNEAVTAVADGMRGKEKTRKVLVIDEIQSKRHQEGRERGYMPNLEKEYEQKEAIFLDAQDAYINYLKETYNVSLGTASQSEIESLRAKDAKLQDLWEVMQDANGDLKDVGRRQALQLSDARSVPDAPFDKNWHELAMKRMLRYAAEEGYDVIAWTKGEQQAERYNLSHLVKRIRVSKPTEDGSRIVDIHYRDEYDDFKNLVVDADGKIVHGEYAGNTLADVVGKEMALQIMNSEEATEFKGEGLKVGGEGMKGFYDKMLPAFMNKYGKKWGVKVEDIELPNLEGGLTMHSVPVTEEMKSSVMEGQVMFSVRNTPISPEVRAEMDVIAATAMVNGNYMLAPNGQPTKLTADQWAMVRTKNFINWFGDWINDPENASKIVDENGEPMVMYHGSAWEPLMEPKGKAVFRMNDGLLGKGAYFSNQPAETTLYAEIATGLDTTEEGNYELLQDKYVTDHFLNVRNEEDIFREGDDMVAVAKAPSQIKSATDNTGEFSESEDVRFSALTSEEYSEDGTRFSAVTDPMLVAQFESEPKVKVYRAMQLIDGKLYPPMSAYVDGVLREPSELGQWEQAEENTIGRNKKDPSKVDLEQGKGDDGKKRKTSGVLYNPYFHTSLTPLNDQFSGAQTRSNLVIVETEVPQSELTSGYQAEGAANSVGMVDWHSGPIAGVLAQYEGKGRQVILSRWAKPIRIVPESEIADIAMKLFEGTTLMDVPLPSNVFTPALREELERRGMKFVETTNNGKLVSDKRRTWSKTYGKNGLAKRSKEDVRFSAVSTPVDDVIEDGLMLSIEDFARLAGDIFSVLPESVRNKVMEEAFRNGFDMQSAIFQIPARLAEKMGWDEADKELARAIRDKVQDAVDASGVATERPITSKEAMWMLYNATQPVAYGDLIGEAGKALAAHNLGFDPKSEALKEKTDAAIRYSAAGGRAIDAATDMYNYEANLWINRLAESWLDMHKSVIALQKALADASGKPIESWEDIVLALNQLSSKSYADKKKYMRDFLKPLWDTVLDMVEKEYLSIEQIERYMMLKHGLERNDKLAKRDAREFYRAMYGLVAERMKSQSHAQQVVALSEAKKRLADIDAQIAAASSSQLPRLNEARARAQYDVDVADIVLRGDEQQNEADLQAHYDAIDNKVDPKYREFRKKDYGGLSGMFVDFDRSAVGKRSKYKTEEAYQAAVRAATKPKFNNVEDVELVAENEVAWFEKGRESQIKELWQKINAATKETLRHQHASGMITTEQYDAVRDMFEYYVPLRGFADNTAEDMYSYYMSNSAGGFAKPLIAAKGRKTKAESPLGWIGTMAESAIQQDNKNDVKMRLYYALLNRPDNGLLSMSETWYEYSHTDSVTGKKVFVPAFPPATGGVLSADQMRAHMDAWEAGMKAKQAAGQAYKASQKIDLKGSVIFQDIKEEKEHIIQVRVAGKEYSIIVNGNPRAAQAINGLLNPDAKHGPFRDAIGWVRRGMSSLMTSLSPLFWVSNYQRDILSSTMRTSLEYGWKEAWNYFNNRRKAWRVASYIYKYEEGTLGDSYYENLYKEFAENGGITGYTVLATNKEYEKMLENYAKHVDQKVLNFIRNIWDKFMGFGEAIEQVSRFAAYITARESGKSIEESVSAAKEVSVNFNRKGSASPISWEESGKLRKKNGKPLNKAERIFALILSAMPGAMKETYFFFNASVQATSSTFQKAKKSPGKAAAWASFIFGTSLAVALINNMLADDDDEEYLDLPDYLRQSNILIPVGDGYYIKWSIPQEVRPFYSMADILVSKIKGKTPHKNAWQVGKEMALTIMQWLPMNPFDAEDPILAFVPDWIAPEAEAWINKTAFGGKVYDDMMFKPEAVRENIPAYRKATSKTGRVYVEMSELLNAISGGDEVQKGAININPAVVEHLVEGHLAGMYDLAKMVVSLPMSILRGEDVELRDIPFVNKVVMSADETNMHSRVNEAFYYYQDIATNAKRVEKEYRDLGMSEKAASYRMTDDWRIHMLFNQYEPDLKEYKDKLKDVTDEGEKDLLLDGQNVIREQLINDIASGKGPDPVTEIRLGIKSMEEEVKRTTKPYKDADKRVKEARERKDYEAKAKAQKERDSIKRTDEYKSAKIMEKEIKELKKRLDGLGSESSPAQRDSVIGEIERDYEALIGKIMRSSSE